VSYLLFLEVVSYYTSYIYYTRKREKIENKVIINGYKHILTSILIQ